MSDGAIKEWEGSDGAVEEQEDSDGAVEEREDSDGPIEEWETASEDESSEGISSDDKRLTFSRKDWKPPQASLLTSSLSQSNPVTISVPVEATTVRPSLLSFL